MSEQITVDSMIGTVVLVRDNRAGVHVGTLQTVDLVNKTCVLTDARKIWYWYGAGSVHGIASNGLDQEKSRVACKVATVASCDVVEIVSMTQKGIDSVFGTPEWLPT